jgi:N-carbamoylputrescine amidase
MRTPAFTVGIVQERAGDADLSANRERQVARVREAHALGARVICLQELFNAPYFCKKEDAARFELAEPIPGPTTLRMQELARELGCVLVAPLFEREAPGIYRNSAAIIDADGSLLGVYR